MRKIKENKMECITGGLTDLKCIYVGALAAQLSIFGLSTLLSGDIKRCWDN